MTSLILAGAVTRNSPAFHNPGHLRMWNDSPLRDFDPHILTAVLAIIIISAIGYYIYFSFKNREQEAAALDMEDEKDFQQLLSRRKAIVAKMVELEEAKKAGQIDDEAFAKSYKAYKDRLIKVKVEINKYTN